MRSLPLNAVRLTDPFWSRYVKVLIEETLPLQFEQLEKTARFANFRRAAGQEEGNHEGIYFNDSDVYKYIEACAYALTSARDIASSPALEKVRSQMDIAIDTVISAQEPDGYLNTFFQLKHPDLKWRNLHSMHEMYCEGHLIEAAVAVFIELGDRRLLDTAIRFANHTMSVFGPSDKPSGYPKWTGTQRGYCGHEEIELALIKLTDATGDPVYRAFAEWMVEERGHSPSMFEPELDDAESLKLSPNAKNYFSKDGKYNGEYFQDHAPIREHDEVVGHAVRAMYLYIAAADIADGRGDTALDAALTRTWANLTGKRMYVTGGIGPSSRNEGFTGDFDLPNLTAYAETCAAIGLVLWGHRLLEMTGNGDYADVIERALYNGALSGISLDGGTYFYDNPLESRGQHKRTPWFTCACCPPNIARLIASVSRLALGVSDKAVYIHLPIGLKTSFTVGGVKVDFEIVGDYPRSGKFKVKVNPERPVHFALNVRIPEWAEEVSTDLPGAEEEAGFDAGYAVFERTWKPGDVMEVDYDMQPVWVESDPRVRDNLGRAALTYGPLIYCAERHDVGYAPQLFSADLGGEVEVASEKMLEGVNVLMVDGMCELEQFVDSLYAPAGTTDLTESRAKFIPYYAWNNRGANDMQVWVRKM